MFWLSNSSKRKYLSMAWIGLGNKMSKPSVYRMFASISMTSFLVNSLYSSFVRSLIMRSKLGLMGSSNFAASRTEVVAS